MEGPFVNRHRVGIYVRWKDKKKRKVGDQIVYQEKQYLEFPTKKEAEAAFKKLQKILKEEF